MANDLVVQLGAKLDQFAKDMDQAGDIADSAIDRIEQSFSNLNPTLGGFASLGTAAAGVTGAVGVLLTALSHVNSEMADLQKNAEFVGTTAERFQRIQFAASVGGVSSSDSVDDLRKVASLLADAKENENSLTRLLDANNIKYKDRNGQVINLNQLLTIAGNLLNKFDSMPEKTKAAQMLGLSQNWVQALRNGSDAFEDIAQSADSAGAVIDNATVAKAALFDEAWKRSTAQLSSQFKSVTVDIAVWLDELIDKANDLLTATLATQNIKPGSGQETFNAYADALDILRKDMQGASQDADQLSRVIERMKNSGKGDPEIIAGLELIRAKAVLAAKMLQAVAEEQSKVSFPDGVPVPKPRPASANDSDPNAAKLPKRKDGEEAADAYDRATESVEKHTARTIADTEAVGKGAAAQAELRAEAQLLQAAQQAGIPVTDKVRDQIQDLAQDAGDAAAALAKAKVASDISFGKQTAFLSSDDVSIARQLASIYGNDVPAALASSEAAALRTNKALSDISGRLQSGLVTGLADIADGTKTVSQGFADLGKSILRMLTEAAIKAAIVAPIFNSLGGVFGSLGLGSLGGSSVSYGAITLGGAAGPTPFASGTDYAPGGLSLIGEHGPELMNVPRGAQIIPNDVLKNGGIGSGSTTVQYSIDARGADSGTVARIQSVLAQHARAIAGQGKAMQSAQRSQLYGVS